MRHQSAVEFAFAMLFAVLPLCAGQTDGAGTGTTGGLITLYARDGLSHTLCLADGRYGTAVQGNIVKNRCSDLDFDSYNPGSFTTGIEGGRIAAIVDVGAEAELQTRYKVHQTVGGGQAFASIRREGQKLYIAADGKELAGVEGLFGKLRSSSAVPIQVGHIYVLRIADDSQAAKEISAKLLVVSYAQGDSVTIRWQLL